MMREIIFRGKRIDNGEWVEGDLLTLHDGRRFIVDNRFGACIDAEGNFINTEAPFVCEVDPDTVGQYTGLKDKNGKRIFEGDIVRHCNSRPYAIPYAIPTIIEKGEVYWCEEQCGWRRTSSGAFHHGVVDTYRMSPYCVYEIIGNVHDAEAANEAE